MPASALLSRLRDHADRRPDEAAFIFLRRHDEPEEILTWHALRARAAALAQRLPLRRDAQATGILIFCADERNFVVALIATWMRGAVAIPATGGLNAHLASRNRHIADCARPDAVIHDLPPGRVDGLCILAPEARMIAIEDSDDDPTGADPAADETRGGLLQFTSGSTLSPKPILLGPAEIAINCAAICETYALGARTVGVHWLPLFHDMGLVGSVLTLLWLGAPSVILRPSIFIQRPIAWLEQISRWRATVTSAPNFAYDWLCRRVTPAELDGLDLSCLENVIFGGEPVAQATVERLLDLLAPHGLSADAIAPSYGMAEVALLVSSGKRKGGPRFGTRHSAAPVACLGPAIAALRATVRGGPDQAILGEGALGEIWLEGDCAGIVVPPGGAWRSPPARGPIRTGDFGYVEDGRIYVTGRDSNKIIVRGCNIFAEDVEGLARRSQPPGRIGGIAAFGIDGEGSEHLCLLIEPAGRGIAIDIAAVNQAISAALNVKPVDIVQLRGGTLPRTSSGKIRRGAARAAFLQGALGGRTIDHVHQAAH